LAIAIPPASECQTHVIEEFGDIDIGLAAGIVQGSAHDQRSAGVALDQQDHLTVSEQWGKRSRHHRLSIAAGHYDDDISAVEGRSEIRRGTVYDGEPIPLALDLHPTARPDFGEPRIVNIVEPQLETGDA
jgi:hypothetical protein